MVQLAGSASRRRAVLAGEKPREAASPAWTVVGPGRRRALSLMLTDRREPTGVCSRLPPRGTKQARGCLSPKKKGGRDEQAV